MLSRFLGKFKKAPWEKVYSTYVKNKRPDQTAQRSSLLQVLTVRLQILQWNRQRRVKVRAILHGSGPSIFACTQICLVIFIFYKWPSLLTQMVEQKLERKLLVDLARLAILGESTKYIYIYIYFFFFFFLRFHPFKSSEFWVRKFGNPGGFYAIFIPRHMIVLMGKFVILTELSARDTSVFSFPDDNFSKYQWIFTKLGVCIDIVETLFGIAGGLISSVFDRVIYRRCVCIFISGR